MTYTLVLANTHTVPLWATILVGVAGAGAALLVALAGRISEERNRRRDLYAEAVKTLIAWTEYPFQVRRRTSDEPDELRRLVDRGHDLQEGLAYHETWLAADKAFLGDLYGDVVARVKERTHDPIADAWTGPPRDSPTKMNLGDWWTPDFTEELDTLRGAIANRFGWRRLLAALHLRHPRLPKRR